MRSFLLVLMLACGVSTASGQSAAEKPEGVGIWELSDPTGERRCPLVLHPGKAGQRHTLDATGCHQSIPAMAQVTGWTNPRTGELRFVDGSGAALFRFIEVEEGMYEAIRPDGSFLLATTAVASGSVSLEDALGDWQVRRAGNPLCMLELAHDPVDGEMMPLTVKPNCAQEIAIFNWVNWKLERGALILRSRRGDTFKLAPTADGGWRAPGPPSDAIVLARPPKE